jgi:hypothetical protein
MSEWPIRYDYEVDKDGVIIGLTDKVKDGVLIYYEDFERILNFAAKAMIAGKLIEHHDIKGVEKIILETIRGNNG